MQLKPITTLVGGIASVAALGLLTIFLVRQTNAPQLSEIYQPAASAAPATAAPIESQVPAQDTVAPRKMDVSREARRKQGHLRGAALESRGVSLAFDPSSLDDNIVVPVVPSSTATVEEVADSFMPLSETGEPSDDQSVFASPPVPEASQVSTYLPGPLPATPEESYVSTYLSGRASTLLAEIQREAVGLNRHAETLGTFARNPQFSWQSHAFYLDGVKGHINAVGERTAELQRISYAVLPWQQQAVTEVTAHAAQVAASTQAAIVHLRENQNRLFVSEYRDHLMTIADRSEDMKQSVDKFLDYEKTQQKLQQLQNELELSGD